MTEVQNTLYVATPKETVESVPIISSTSDRVAEGENILKRIRLLQPGVYMISVNNVEGETIMSRPLYVGKGYPLLPDE